jgi:uncharacterized membrane protein (DUF2068 family)
MVKKSVKKELKAEAKKTAIKRQIPLGIKIICIVFLAMAVLSAYNGFMYASNKAEITSTLQEQLLQAGADSATAQSIIPMIIGIIIGGYFLGVIVYLILGAGLWKLKRWARIITIILAILSIIASLLVISAIFSSWLSAVKFIATIAILIYLLFSREVKEAFAKKQAAKN